MLDSLYSSPLHGVECLTNGKSKRNDLPFSVKVNESAVTIPNGSESLWSLTDSGQRYTTRLNIYKSAQQQKILEVQCEGVGRFLLGEQDITIDWHAGGTSSTHYFQTVALALWLELKGIPCIHANALEYKGKTIALLGPSGMGKSTLSAFLQQNGFKWLTDDMLALHNLADTQANYQGSLIYPSWSKARMWPDSLQELTSFNTDKLNRVHHRFHKREIDLPSVDTPAPFKLDAIYLLNREGNGLSNKQTLTALPSSPFTMGVKNMSPTSGVITLLQNSMLGDAYRGLELEAGRLQQLSKMVSVTSFKQINYKGGLDGLAQLKNMLLEDLF